MKRVAVAVAALALVFGTALAQPGPCPSCPEKVEEAGPAQPGMPGMMGVMPDIPDLTPEQMEKFDALRTAHLKTVMPIRTDIRVAEIELDAFWRAEKLDAKKVVAKVKEIGELRQKLELVMVNHRIEMHNSLTPEQQKAMRKKMGMGRAHGMMRGMGRGRMGRGKMCMGQGGPMGQCGPQECEDCRMH